TQQRWLRHTIDHHTGKILTMYSANSPKSRANTQSADADQAVGALHDRLFEDRAYARSEHWTVITVWSQDAILIDMVEDTGRHKLPGVQSRTMAQTTGASFRVSSPA